MRASSLREVVDADSFKDAERLLTAADEVQRLADTLGVKITFSPRAAESCLNCGGWLEVGSRSNRRYCSVNCRMAAYRQRKKDV